MSRHPYTYSADLIRHFAGYKEDGSGTVLSRSQAAQISAGIAEVLGISKEEFCIKLSEYYQNNVDALAEKSVAAFAATRR